MPSGEMGNWPDLTCGLVVVPILYLLARGRMPTVAGRHVPELTIESCTNNHLYCFSRGT